MITEQEFITDGWQAELERLQDFNRGKVAPIRADGECDHSNLQTPSARISDRKEKPGSVIFNPERKFQLMDQGEAMKIVSSIPSIRVSKGKSTPKQRNRTSLLGSSKLKMEIAKEVLSVFLSSKLTWHDLSQKQIAKILDVSLASVGRVFVSLVASGVLIKYSNHYKEGVQAIVYRISDRFICEKRSLKREKENNTSFRDGIYELVSELKKRKVSPPAKRTNSQRNAMMFKLGINPFEKRVCASCESEKTNNQFSIIRGTGMLYNNCQECFESTTHRNDTKYRNRIQRN